MLTKRSSTQLGGLMHKPSRVIAFLGAGNLARSIIGGLIKKDYPVSQIIATRRDAERLQALKQEFNIHVYNDNCTAVENADVIVLSVKPADVQGVLRQISQTLDKKTVKPLFISLAAGVLVSDMQRWLGYDASIIRSMCNTPALIGEGASALYASTQVTTAQKEIAENLLQAVGKTCWAESEKQLNDIMPLVSSGPGYVFMLIEKMIEAAVQMGIPKQTASEMAIQTFYGAAKLAATSAETPEQLRKRVTTPNGVTHQGIVIMENTALHQMFEQAMRAGAKRGDEYAEMFGKDITITPTTQSKM